MYAEFNNVAKPFLESQGNSFLNGVKFSVQTISLGKDE